MVTHRGVVLPAGHPRVSAAIRDTMYSGGYETEECDLLNKTLEADDRVLELGAGVGFLGAFCSRWLGDSGRVCCVEANPEVEAVAEETFRLNGVAPRFISGVVSPVDGEVPFYIAEDFWSSSTLRRNLPGRNAIVRAVSFNRLLTEFAPTYVVCDVEGAECTLLQHPMRGVTKVLVEIHPHVTGSGVVNEMVDSLRGNGFAVDYMASTKAVLFLRRH